MEKPRPTIVTQSQLDWHEVQGYIEDKYDIDIRGYGKPKNPHQIFESEGNGNVYASPQNYGGKYYAWIDGKGEKVEVTKDIYDEELVKYSTLNKKFAEWKKETYGEEPPYMDFWHYLIECNNDVSHGSFVTIPKVEYKCPNSEIGKGTEWEGWVQKITDLIFEEFGEYADDEYGLEVWVEW